MVGAIARAVDPGRQPMRLRITMTLEITGSLVGGVISWLIAGISNRLFFEVSTGSCPSSAHSLWFGERQPSINKVVPAG